MGQGIGSRPADPAAVESALRSLPGVGDAAVVVRGTSRTPEDAPSGPAPAASSVSPAVSLSASPTAPEAIVHGPPLEPPGDAPATLQEALIRAATRWPGRGTTYVLPDGGQDRQTYAELLQEALRVLRGLRELGVRPGDAALLQCADSRSFVTAFWACVLGGVLPTPVGPAPGYGRENAVTRKLRSAWRLLDHPVIVTDDELRDPVAGLGRTWSEPALTVASVTELGAGAAAEPVPVGPDDPVLNLLTSGSTGTPKCVRHASRSIVNRTFATIDANGFTPEEVSLNWMPLDHVGGIVMYNVRDVILGCDHVNARTDAFVRRPLSWLDWADRFGATNTWAPNFAFALLNECEDEIARGSWDLSRLRNICNAGEAVVARTAHRFVELLRPHGLPEDAMVPCWGMSETSSGVTYSRLRHDDHTAGTICVDPRSLGGELREVPHGTPRSVVLTEVGAPVAGVSLRIVDGAGAVLREGQVGRLHVRGATLLREYYRNPEANAEAFTADGWFDTGDLGLLRGGSLTLTGRAKDMIIVNGANFPAHDLESVVGQVPGVRATFAAVCGVSDPQLGTDAVVVFYVPSGADTPRDRTATAIRAALAAETGLQPQAVVALEAEEFPKTASGKIQRSQLVDAYREGRYDGRLDEHGDDGPGAADAWMFERVWVPDEGRPADPPREPVLVYGDRAVAAAVGRVTGHPVAWIRRGTAFRDLSADLPDAAVTAVGASAAGTVPSAEFSGSGAVPDVSACVEILPLDPAQHEHALEVVVARAGGLPRFAVHAWEAEPDSGPGARDADDAAEGLLLALRALAAAPEPVTVGVITSGATGARPGEPVEPGRAALTGLVRTAHAEGSFAGIRLVDLPPGTVPADEAVRAALAPASPAGEVTALRDGLPHVPRLRAVPERGGRAVPAEVLRPGGTALLVGGLGGIGAQVAAYLLAAVRARVLVVGRTPQEKLDDERAATLRRLRALGECSYAAADAADGPAMSRAVAEAERAWGRPLDTVMHLAGADVREQWKDLGGHLVVNERPEWLRHMLRPKLAGGRVLEELLASRPETSVVLFSSVNGFLGGASFGSYAAANAALDGFAGRWAGQGRTVRCLAWSMWADVGMNRASPLTEAARSRGLRVVDRPRGLALLLDALNQDHPYLLLGADPANEHMWPHLVAGGAAGARVLVAIVPDGSVPEDELEKAVGGVLADLPLGAAARTVQVRRIPRGADGSVNVTALLASRAGPATAHVPPQGEVESGIARIWGEVVGVEQVGREDTFFGIGGNSILAMRAVDRMNRELGGDHPVAVIYEHPVLRELAAALAGRR
ncbi:acyl-CoA synthetase (AMP-forming)/AMP-acid ligase II/short-subunit dehydrogenase involved in D-alanine esterification of teichoic acids [Streptosporangium becharense]|uniref:Acyl-CoA synthetase (AMP-forming)/AMP-acid ligase II/short-subunit dehydrogenase involved in D-alanine esterification of teichoic acids n=1 Tax=Streptosporangium becharense TaxID=1816182 RepID=A0A7W9MJD5_9ACTN|nr:SDR family NAD(P)-dependent oxidoreductase [Streptosporangium becharense]MBB2910394.1 acyl-CoA synthetase (AMP-forming)/AMP-acid ligase II/short-subunit dehydrogenase involved in D-alanine esterification of teichoic acids [Streptosporangium becharense]MBB5823137.1 acyl-CoA synthetase (AMP-forming)/AMP-acid ligase II/short-subunit dehydrogenase involved in D-alanine esterification of teichoic acids [Streptosporangium becharense]